MDNTQYYVQQIFYKKLEFYNGTTYNELDNLQFCYNCKG